MGFKEAMQEYGKEITASFRCYDVTEEGSVDENSYVEYGDDSIISMRFHYEGALLKSVMRCLDIEIKRDANNNIGINSFLKNVRFGVKAPGSDYSYKEYGTYIVKDMKIDEEQDTIILECYDLMLMSMVPYDLPYNDARYTLNDLLWDVCARFGWERGYEDIDYTNKDFQLVEYQDPYDESYTFRDVLDDIAEATASIVAFVDDKLTIIYPTNKQETVDTSNLKSLKIGEVYGPVNSVVISRSPQEDNIYKRNDSYIAIVGLTEIRIENNPIIDQNRDYAIDRIYVRTYDWQYTLYELESFGIGYIDLGDIFSIKTADGVFHQTIMLCDDLLINQGVTEKCYVEAPEATETDYKAASTTDRMINQTVLKVNKQEQTITGLVSKTQALDNSVNGLNGTVTKMSELLMDEEKVSIKITEAINGINSIETSTGYTFDKDGLRIAKSDSLIENLIDNTGMYVKRGGSEIVLQANQDGVEALNLTSRQFLIVGDNSRFENFNDGTGNRTACFYIGG